MVCRFSWRRTPDFRRCYLSRRSSRPFESDSPRPYPDFRSSEIEYYKRLSPRSRADQTAELVAGSPPAFIIAQGLETPPDIMTECDEKNIPLFSTPLPAAQVIDYLRVYLSKKLAQRVTMHGVFMDVLGVGVLITGESGLGKSELGLELISRSHGLVADDAVEFARIAPNMIEGRCPPLLQNMLEVRGLGLLDIRTIFGETAVRRKNASEADRASGPSQNDGRKLRASATDIANRRNPRPADSQSCNPGRSRSKSCRAAGSRSTQHNPAIARHRYVEGFHRAPAKSDGNDEA
jgi:hypothetical protein